MLIVWTQAIYLVLSVGMTIYVAHSLKINGRVFLLKSFKGDNALTDSVTNLLVVGFYLINIGWVLFWTKYGAKPDNLEYAIEFITTKVGVVLMILGGMHFLNIKLFWRLQHNDGPNDGEVKRDPLMMPTYPEAKPPVGKG